MSFFLLEKKPKRPPIPSLIVSSRLLVSCDASSVSPSEESLPAVDGSGACSEGLVGMGCAFEESP